MLLGSDDFDFEEVGLADLKEGDPKGREVDFFDDDDAEEMEVIVVSNANEGFFPKSFSSIFSLESTLDMNSLAGGVGSAIAASSSASETSPKGAVAFWPAKMGPPNASWAKTTVGGWTSVIHEGGASSTGALRLE